MTKTEREAELDALMAAMAPLNTEKAQLEDAEKKLRSVMHYFFADPMEEGLHKAMVALTSKKLDAVKAQIAPYRAEMKRLTIEIVEDAA